MEIFPPLTTNETAVFEALASDSAGECTAEMIAERTGLDKTQVERALHSLESRNPPLAIALSFRNPPLTIAFRHDGWKPARH
jgi:DNA-binding MarR family transcriptional regulator